MKTEQIAKKAKEYSFNMYSKNLDLITQIESAFKNGYEDGYRNGLDEFALAEIQAYEKGLAQKEAEWQEKIKSILHTIGFIIDMHGQIDTESKLIELYRHLDKLTCEE